MLTHRNKMFIVLTLVCIIVGCGPRILLPQVSPTHQPIYIALDFNEIWALSNVYSIQSSTNPMFSAADGIVCFIGSMQANDVFKVICLDGFTGEILWEKDAFSSGNLIVKSDGVYVTSNGSANITKYDFNGNLLWSKILGGAGVKYLYIVDDFVQVLTDKDELLVLSRLDGTLIAEYYSDKILCFSDSKALYTVDGGLQSADKMTDEILWQVELDDVLLLTPLFLPDKIFVRSGRTLGSVYAVDRDSGLVLWSMHDVISNIVYSGSADEVYVISRDGNLIRIHAETGEISVVAELSSTPFVVNGEDVVGGYDLSYDDSTHILYASLGDSRQLLALQITKIPSP